MPAARGLVQKTVRMRLQPWISVGGFAGKPGSAAGGTWNGRGWRGLRARKSRQAFIAIRYSHARNVDRPVLSRTNVRLSNATTAPREPARSLRSPTCFQLECAGL